MMFLENIPCGVPCSRRSGSGATADGKPTWLPCLEGPAEGFQDKERHRPLPIVTPGLADNRAVTAPIGSPAQTQRGGTGSEKEKDLTAAPEVEF
jgi:hypothetical protein